MTSLSESIYDKARRVLKETESGTPREALENMNVSVKASSMHGAQDLRAICACIRGGTYVRYNERLSDRGVTIVLAHELGHIILHKTDNHFYDFSGFCQEVMISRKEIEANLFAADFLISDRECITELKKGYTLEQIACELYLPAGLVLYKLKSMKDRNRLRPCNLEPVNARIMSEEDDFPWESD